MTRILLHPGFHKTGTKSVQHFLLAAGPLIWPHAALVLPDRMRDISRLTFWHAEDPGPGLLAMMTAAMRDFLSTLSLTRPGRPPRDIVISAENLLGPMPRGDGPPYPAAAAILTALVRALRERGEVSVYLSLRDQGEWARSVHAHLARKPAGPRITLGADAFADRLAPHPLARIADGIAAALPGTPVIAQDIADLSGERFGIAQPFVDFLRLPPAALDRLPPVPHLHRAPDPAITAQLIGLNRSPLTGEALAAAKRDLLAARKASA